jgi:hypothetical protein
MKSAGTKIKPDHTDLKTLKEAIRKGIESGEATPLDMNEIIAEARQRQKSNSYGKYQTPAVGN